MRDLDLIPHLSILLLQRRLPLSHPCYISLIQPIHQSQAYAATYDSMSSLFRTTFGNQTSQTSLIMQLTLSLSAPPLAKSEGPVPATDRPRVSAALVHAIQVHVVVTTLTLHKPAHILKCTI